MPADAIPRLSVVIPARNEEQRLPATLQAVLGYLVAQPYDAEILVVDDGSEDGTPTVVHDFARQARVPLRLVQYPNGRHRGKGAAVRCGMAAARGAFRLFMDGDNAITIDNVERFWPVFDTGADVVIGTPEVSADDAVNGRPWYRRAAGRGGNFIIRSLALSGIENTQTGFKMFSAACITNVLPRLTIDRWGFDVEMLVVCRQLGYSIQVVPVTVVYHPGSKVRVSTYFQVLQEVWQVRRNLRAGRYR